MRLQKVMGQTLHSIPPGEDILSPYSMVVDDIKNKRYSLQAVSIWKLKEKTCREFSLHEQLMMELKNPPKLRRIFEQKSINNYKGDTQKFVLNSPHNTLSPTYKQTCSRWSLPSIADLMGTRYLEIKDSCRRETSKLPSRAELCLLCHNQFFIWPYVCHLCSSVICKDCCIKMSMPVRACARLPLNFFKVIQLGKEDDQDLHNQKAAQLEVEKWDSSRN